MQPSFLSQTSLFWGLFVFFNTFNKVIVFLKLENDSSFEIPKFLISGQFRKLKEENKVDHTFVICFKGINSNINSHWLTFL